MGATTFVREADSAFAEGKQSLRNYYFGEHGRADPGPEGFMLRFRPGAGLPAHFHDVNQFQVFFGSPGATFGRHAIPDLMVHYAAAGSLYGPFAAGTEEPLVMLTLRQEGNTFTGLMPDDRERLAPPDRRCHLEEELSPWLSGTLPEAGEAVTTEFFVGEAGGVLGAAIAAGPRASLSPPAPRAGGGQYYVVVEGSLAADGRRNEPITVGWSASDAPSPELYAGDDGLRLLVLQFARAA